MVKVAVESARYRMSDIHNKFRNGGIDRAMNHFAQTFDSKLDSKSPTCERLISARPCNQSPKTPLCGSWKFKIFAEVMECKDAIKSKASKWGSKLFAGSRSTTSASSIPDIVTFSVIAKKEEVLIKSSLHDTSENQKTNAPVNSSNVSHPTDILVNRFLDKHSTNGSPKLFLELEKEEFPEDLTGSSMKRKISVHPLLLRCSEDTGEFDWLNDTEDSFSSKPGDSPEPSNMSDIVFEDPQNNSTFRESIYDSKKCESSIVRLDSGCESNFSI